MSIFTPRAIRQVGRLAFDALAIGRGEQLVKRQASQPHHQECPLCGFDRWDGASEHRWGGRLGAHRLCFGPGKDGQKKAPEPATPSHPLVDELRGYIADVDGDAPSEAPPAETRPEGFLEVLGDARER